MDENVINFGKDRYTKVKMSKSFPEGMGWRVTTSIITFFAAIIGIILWLFFYAENFNVYQNIAIVVVIFLSFIALMGATWASWGMKQREASRRSSKKDDYE